MKRHFRALSTTLISLTLVGSFILPSRAHAIFGVADVVFDPASLVQMIVDWGVQEVQSMLSDEQMKKEYIFDSIARFAAEMAIQTMAQSMTNWASNGFQGSPAFETDLRNSMLRIGDTVANDFVYQLRTNTALSSPFGSKVASAVQDNYYRTTGPAAFQNAVKFTLSDKCADYERFLAGEFSACGPQGWMQAWLSPANNPLGTQLVAEDQLAQLVSTAASDRIQELDWGEGFLSWKGDCQTIASTPTHSGDEVVPPLSLQEEDPCLEYAIETPGSVVANSVNKIAVDAGIDFSVNADEINEVIGNFFAQLVTDTLFGNDGGLASSARYERPTPTTPPQSAVNALLQSFSNQKPKLEQYQRNWGDLLSVATTASQRLATCTREGASVRKNEAEILIARANAELERVLLVNEKFAEYQQLLQAAQAGNGDFQAIMAEYELFRSSGVMPSVQDFIYATEQAVSGQSASGQPTLYTIMTGYTEYCSIRGLLGGD
jgi:hypothetical protein